MENNADNRRPFNGRDSRFHSLFAFPESVKGEEKPIKTEEYKFVLTLWNIDVFEGGMGSRADFLTARANERTDDGIIILVKSHTPESVKKSIENGEIPDMVSFGVGSIPFGFSAANSPRPTSKAALSAVKPTPFRGASAVII